MDCAGIMRWGSTASTGKHKMFDAMLRELQFLGGVVAWMPRHLLHFLKGLFRATLYFEALSTKPS